MIIDYDHNPNLTYDQKLQSLKESVQMALNEFETNNATSVQNDADPNLAKTIIENYTGSTLAGSAQSVKSAVDALDSAVDAIADYIVEQGTSGAWTYRKWNSGIAECWGHFGTTTTSNGAWTINFPSELFKSGTYPCVTQTAWYGELTDPDRDARSFYLTDGSSATQAISYFRTYNGSTYSGKIAMQVHAIGIWK